MNKNKFIYLNDSCRSNTHINGFDCINSSVTAIYDDTGEVIFGPLHNKTVIAGAGLTLQKLFGLDRSCLNNTPTYDTVLNLDDKTSSNNYPVVSILDDEANVIGSIADETQRIICGFCVGVGGAGTDSTNPFSENYASWIQPDNLVPFRYPIENDDDVDESIYKGRRTISLSNNQTRCAYYFKEFSNTPVLVQNYVSTIETFTDQISPDTVYESSYNADKAQSFVELHLKINRNDCREFFIAHSGLEQARINQISLVSAWKRKINRTKYNTAGSLVSSDIDVYQQIRPFSLCNFPTEILSDKDKTISFIYTLYC